MVLQWNMLKLLNLFGETNYAFLNMKYLISFLMQSTLMFLVIPTGQSRKQSLIDCDK